MNKKFFAFGFILIIVLLALAGCGSATKDVAAEEPTNTNEESTSKESLSTNENNADNEDKGVVNLFTSRHYDSDTELYKQFTEQTGIEVNVVSGEGDELMERLDREGEATEADIFITSDAGNLARLKERGLTQPIESETIFNNVPEKLRDIDNEWIGLTKRARVIVYSLDRVDPSELSTYEALAEPKWNGRVLIRSSSNIYNQSLLGSLIELNGEEAAKEWAQGVVNNMARDPQGGDTDQVKAIVAGVGDVAIANTYYVGRLANSEDPEDVKIAEQVGLFFPNQKSTGAHVNISGAAITKYAKNVDNATKFLEFLTSTDAQALFAETNNEYPVNPDAETSELLQSWGEFKEQEIDLTVLGTNNPRAIQIFNEVGWK